MLHSNVVQPMTKCYSLMWFISKPIVTLLCGSSNDKMIHSNVVPPYIYTKTYGATFNESFTLCDNSTGVWWDGSKSHRMRHVSREVICMRNRDGSISKWLKISITCLFTEMAHFFEPSRFLWLKKWAISVKRHMIEILSHFDTLHNTESVW